MIVGWSSVTAVRDSLHPRCFAPESKEASRTFYQLDLCCTGYLMLCVRNAFSCNDLYHCSIKRIVLSYWIVHIFFALDLIRSRHNFAVSNFTFVSDKKLAFIYEYFLLLAFIQLLCCMRRVFVFSATNRSPSF